MATRSRTALRAAVVSSHVPAVESLEARQLLSASPVKKAVTGGKAIVAAASSVAKLPIVNKGKVTAPGKSGKTSGTHDVPVTPAVATAPFTPAQLRHFYGVDQIANQGAGQTIAIIDSDNLPSIQSDLATFDAQFGLPAPPSLTVVGQDGSSTLPTTTATGNGALETALDVEWAHAMAPQASLLLIECNSLSTGDLLTAGVATANRSGASVVSMSFGVTDSAISASFVNAYDPLFTATGKTYVASTGDGGAASTGYPATSANVVAVGGTSIATSDNAGSYGSEVVWNDGANSSTGGAISNYSAKPSYQSGVTLSSTKRTVADVSLEASANTGVFVYFGGSYYLAGGTSLSAPCWAGLVADANTARAASGLANLSGRASTLPRLYQLPTADYHDITSGNNNSNSALVGYDLPTGRGTPVANKLVRDLAGGTASGTAFVDKNGDGVFNGTDTVLSGVQVYVDVNNNGVYDGATDLSVTTGSTGSFSFADVVGGLPVREIVPAGYVATGSSTTLGTSAYGGLTGLAAGFFPTAFAATAATTYTLRLDAGGTNEQIFVNAATTGAPTYQIALGKLTTLAFTGSAADDVLNLDTTNGDPTPNGVSVTFAGGGQTTGDRVAVTGPSVRTGGTLAGFIGSTADANAGTVTVGNSSLTYSGVEGLGYTGTTGGDAVSLTTGRLPFAFAGGGGGDALTVSGGTFAPAADLGADGTVLSLSVVSAGAATFSTNQTLASLTLSKQSTAAVTGTGRVLRTTALSVDTAGASALDLGSNAMIVDYAGASPLGGIASALASGYAAGAWTGNGIRSSSAAANTAFALGYGEAGTVLGLTGSDTGTFMGQTVDATSVLVRYTRNGDANLDGAVTIADFNALAAKFNATTGVGWVDGDFNYDGQVTIADFNLLAANFNLSA